ncbi:sodium:solute symporter [Campylobacter sp. FMV-PI01]|uniref:Sodium:solute symporter n=1 Tax=Campylobacter portucalensis TaxID=2608384 RepID=A0A6L5WFY7_9BACT|nr:sodium:solute symporter [Campylobacter portucalensis]MSN96038.1 sodium:solute symporter [Campylobacter portucalensis]
MSLFSIAFWGFLFVYGGILWFLSPKVKSFDGFFKASDEKGREVNVWLLSTSIFISWIFAKSVTNAANLGEKYGIVGGVAYAAYWLCIPVAGIILYRLRTKYNATGLVSFLNSNYGKFASFCFSIAILIRLFNEVWSNTSVVGGYYGESGSMSFIIAALLFTFITLIYSLKGGLRGSVITDIVQAVIFVIGVGFVLTFVLPKYSVGEIVSTGEWSLVGGVDLLLVALLQIFSYPFHDPVLTDRGFLCSPKRMLISFIIAGLTGFMAIFIFSFIGVYAGFEGINGSNIPASVAGSMGLAALFLMNIVMISAAGSTLDSTFASVSKLIAHDWIKIINPNLLSKSVIIGMISMVIIAVVGNFPMFFGIDILKATTISGTMVIGMAPIFLLHGVVKINKLSFYLSFFFGLFCGFIEVFGLFPKALYIGSGDSAGLLGVNLYGLIGCFILYFLGAYIAKLRS